MTNPNTSRPHTLWSTLLAGTLVCTLVLAAPAKDKPAAKPAAAKVKPAKGAPTKAQREKAFMDAMSGTTLTGYFTIVGKKIGDPAIDSYEIQRVTKGGNFFLFHAKFGKAQLPPLPLRVRWAGSKPVITMDKITIPAMGTFSVHLLIDGNMYAGTWSHGETVGHMWGTIKKTPKAKAKK